MDLNRKMELVNCNAGDIVECADGKEYEMIKVNKVKFVAKDVESGVAYNIPFEMFLKVVSKKVADVDKINSLKPGDLFVINHPKGALLFKFEKFEKDRIIGINPLTGIRTKMPKTMFATKVNEL